MKYKNILFDLDGTISNTSAGIFFCFKKTFEEFGIDQSKYNLNEFIGPPLTFSMGLIFEDRAEDALRFFRDLYKDHYCDNELYDGMTDLLASLKQKGYVLGVATSKHQPMAFEVLEKLGVLQYFDFVYGALPNRGEKDEILFDLLLEQDLKKEETVLVGDTVYDMRGAQKVGIDAIGVTYGFGEKKDFVQYHPVAVFDDTTQVKKFLIND